MKYAVRWLIHVSVHSVLCQCYTQEHTHPHPQTIRGQRPTGLKVDIANSVVGLTDIKLAALRRPLVSVGALCSVHVHCTHDLKSCVLPPKSVLISDWLTTVYEQSTKP